MNPHQNLDKPAACTPIFDCKSCKKKCCKKFKKGKKQCKRCPKPPQLD